MELEQNSKTLTVFINGKIEKKCEIQVNNTLTISDLITDCKEKLRISKHCKCKILDSRGEELSDDDLEFINSQEPLFLSQGEKFSKSSTMAIYKEIKKLGQGGFGKVYLYKNSITGQEVAIKFIELRTLMSPQDVQRLYSEIGILRNLKHPNIVNLIDVFDLDDKSCFVMEYCSGGELKEYVQTKGPLNEKEVYRITLQIVDAIRYCHNSLIVHRDLKLENILFSRPSRKTVKIVDFGISGMFKVGVNSEAERSDAGSLHYIAPEVLTKTDNHANPALDIWSLGCIVYAMLTKTLPFTAPTRKEIVNKIIDCDYPELPNTVSKPWIKLIKGLLRKKPESRWDLIKISEHLLKYKDFDNAEISDDSFEKKFPVHKTKTNEFVRVKNERKRTPDSGNEYFLFRIKGIKKISPSVFKRSNSSTPPQPGFIVRRRKLFKPKPPLPK